MVRNKNSTENQGKSSQKKMFKTSENPENSCSGPLKKKTREKTIPLSLNVKK